MKSDMDLVRRILLDIEASPVTQGWIALEIEGHNSDVVSYHVRALTEAGLIDAINLSDKSGIAWMPKRLTWEGHEFLEAARDDSIWRKAMQRIGTGAAGVTFDILKAMLYSLGREKLGLPPE